MRQIEASSGQGWARAAVAVGAVLSVAGNATETVLTESPVALPIRITIATFLPVIVFIAVEVFVRVAWRRMLLDFIGRAMLILLPSFGAAYVSFGHLFSLTRLSGADEVAASANALAIDGLMIGGTVALLAIRAARLAETKEVPHVADLATGSVSEQNGSPAAPVRQLDARPVLVHGGSGDTPAVGRGESRARASSEDQQRAIKLMLAGDDAAAIEAGMGASTLRRYKKVWRELAGNPPVEPDLKAERVKADLVEIIRQHIESTKG